jgi:hypothetical protein
VKLAALIAPLTISLVFWGCGGGSHSQSTVAGQRPTPTVVDQPKATAQCELAMGGTPPRSWRRDATAIASVGFYGSGRNFLAGRFTRRTKSPVIVEGRDPVTLAIAPEDRWHARLLASTSPVPFAPYVEIRFVPCRDQARTTWPAGFQLRNRMPVTVIVHQAGEPDRTLRVGRV